MSKGIQRALRELQALLMQDESQIQYYERILKRMPLPVLSDSSPLHACGGVR
jgi:hypothetical protein